MAHPWMTFFVAMSAVGAIRQLGMAVTAIAKSARRAKDKR